MISTRTYGSSTISVWTGLGRLAGLSMKTTSLLVLVTRYTTEGAVMISSRLYSRSSRSCTISMCSRPRKPQRKPKPMAEEDSVSKDKAASLSLSLSRASRRSGNWSAFVGNRPQNTIGFASSYPGSGSAAGALARVIVSPTRASSTDLMLAAMYPTSPACSSCTRICFGDSTPTSSIWKLLPVFINLILSPCPTCPSITRKYTTTPRYAS
mmetsp:Transcript_6017/g.10333  ORF Transcript_6017/g.10333 Transcript_6017/m.10333 type:complete len:210 (-) Transcript_6017:1024-1653(-)